MAMANTIIKMQSAISILVKIIPWTRSQSNHKGQNGRIGVVGGSRYYAGAPYFAAISSLYLGADLPYVICPASVSPIIKCYDPDLIVLPILDEQDEKVFERETDEILQRLHTLVVGPGLGRDPILQGRARNIVKRARQRGIPLILDADSLKIVLENPEIVQNYDKVLLTPNRVEFSRLVPAFNDIAEATETYVKQLGVSIVVKGQHDLIRDGQGFNKNTDPTSGSSRRCGGQGDILAGLAGTFLHWITAYNKLEEATKIDNPVSWAGYLAAITTRRSNELAFAKHGYKTVASDMIDQIQPALQSLLCPQKNSPHTVKPNQPAVKKSASDEMYQSAMTMDEIRRYKRQLTLVDFGPERQLKLKKSSAIIIGAGGLGCPTAAYLGAAGIGRLGIVDDDRVEESNLHRQILHNVHKIGMLKTDSIKEAVSALNPHVTIDTYPIRLNRYNAVDLIQHYDMVIDASDNQKTRYLIGDACVVAKKTLISGSALKMDGQLSVFNYNASTPCYRCIYPVPTPSSLVGSCSDNGVLGIVPGILGDQMALEAIKIGAGIEPSYAGKILLFEGVGRFRQIACHTRRADCQACGKDSKLGHDLIDYDEFCNQAQVDDHGQARVDKEARISVHEYSTMLQKSKGHVLIDVRPHQQSSTSSFKHALRIPLAKLSDDANFKQIIEAISNSDEERAPVVVVCRKGIASRRGALVVRAMLQEAGLDNPVIDIVGGMSAWSSEIDPNFACL